MNKKIYIGMLFASMLFVACGSDGGANSMTTGTDLSAEVDYSVEAYESLPVCSDRKDGQMGYVKGTSKYYVCEDGEWVVTRKSSSSNFSVSEDKPGSGLFGKSSGSTGTGFGDKDQSSGILTDARDGQKYKTTTIGDQVWMAENLNYKVNDGKQSWCYDNKKSNCEKYGRLYTWEVAQKVCPSGWHLPSKEDFESLLDKVGSSDEERSANLRDSFWSDGKNKYGFSALPAGRYYSYSNYEEFYLLGDRAYFWSSKEGYAESAYSLEISDYDAYVSYEVKDDVSSVRCLKDN